MRILVTGGSGFIGTNFIEVALERGIEILNLDISPPKKQTHIVVWKPCDIMDFNACMDLFQEFQPTHALHLAARTDTDSNELMDYKVNSEGTDTFLRCIKSMPGIKRAVITSTQFVFAPPGLPENDEQFNPIGAYGMTKVLAEKATRAAELDCTWTIIRPTNIWGPWHPRYPKEFWLVLKKGWYLHPGGAPVMRSYGYVKNVVNQTLKIFEAPATAVHAKVFYVGDPPIPLFDWANLFSLAITGKPVRVVPRMVLRMLAVVGSLLRPVGIRFPITLSRYRSMTEDYLSPMEVTLSQFGAPEYSLQEGVEETVTWLKEYWNTSLQVEK